MVAWIIIASNTYIVIAADAIDVGSNGFPGKYSAGMSF